MLEIIDEARSKGPTTLAIEKLFASEPVTTGEFAGKLGRRKTGRVSNLGNISSTDFENLLQQVFDTKVTVLGPGEGNNPSRQFNAYQFDTEKGVASIILAGEGAVKTQRQERGLIDAINNSNVSTIKFANRTLTGVTKATKVERVAGYRHEPYADVKLKIGEKTIKISAKGFQAPTFGGGGLSGINEINIKEMNQFVTDTYTKVYNEYKAIIDANPELKDQNLQGDPRFKDHYEIIPKEVLKDLLTGVESIGGKVDYYYTGNMDVDTRIEGGVLVVDGNLLTVDEFIQKTGVFYLRIAKRDGPCYFTAEMNELSHITVPKLFTIKPGGKGGTQSRALITIKQVNRNVQTKPTT